MGTLLQRCHEGQLEGGLSVDLDVRPDELVGALAAAVGGKARTLKVLDVLEGPPLTLFVRWEGGEGRWAVPDLGKLVERMNTAFRQDTEAKAVAVLGEWEGSLELWCIRKQALSQVMTQADFVAENRRLLEKLTVRGRT